MIGELRIRRLESGQIPGPLRDASPILERIEANDCYTQSL